jgi:ferredoxin
MDGDEYPTRLLDNETILEAAKRIGLDAPYSCQNGSCSTCRAKLLEGKVYMKVNFALNPKDVASGFILTCQSLPLTENLVVSYDEAV